MEIKYSVSMKERSGNSSHRIILSRISPSSTVLSCGCATGDMTRFMKEDGTIIALISNVAHADVPANLLNGRRNDTPLGLLDHTQIHSQAGKDLDDLFQQTGLTIVEKDYSILPAFTTEQKGEDQTEGLPSASHSLGHQPYADVYQFVYCAKKTDYVCEKGISCTDHYAERHLAYWSEPPGRSETQDDQDRLAAQNAEWENHMQIRGAQMEQHAEGNRQHRERFDTISKAIFRKITKPVRFVLAMIRTVLQQANKILLPVHYHVDDFRCNRNRIRIRGWIFDRRNEIGMLELMPCWNGMEEIR